MRKTLKLTLASAMIGVAALTFWTVAAVLTFVRKDQESGWSGGRGTGALRTEAQPLVFADAE
jgi:hypothetical protein